MRPLARITETFTESVIREMTRICDAAGGLNLSQGFPDFEAPAEVKQAAIAAIEADLNQYPVTFGEPELRDAIAAKALAYNGIEADPATDITVTCGATEAMIATMKSLINPGDEFVVFEPFYENYGPDGILSGGTPRFVRLEGDDWHYDPEALKAAFTSKTKAILINTPNNPTGKVYTQEEMREIADLCVDHDVYAVTDEIYEHILYDGARHISMASLDGMAERTVTINSISKTYSVTGWRVGWALAPPPITQRIRKVHDFLTVGAPTPLQHAAVTALRLPQDYYTGLAALYDAKRRMLLSALEEAGLQPAWPKGAYYTMARIDQHMEALQASDDVSFARRLIETAGVATVPGSSFFSDPRDGRHLVRFTFCKRQETLQQVRERLRMIRPGGVAA